ncbi:MAG: hypothetical protein Tsb0016_27110 [Sphingomonadales bacterium]
MTKADRRQPLRERVAARRRGELTSEEDIAQRKARGRWRLLGHVLQAVGIIVLLLYVISQYQQGFRSVDYRWILVPSLIFVAGRAIHLWLSMARRR